jgi:hypothetical protein
MSTKYFVDATGVYLGGFAGIDPPVGAIEVPSAPDDARQTWDSELGEWSVLPSLSTDPNDHPLTALEFDAALVRLGIDRDAVAPAIRTVFAGDIDAMADSLARWWNLTTMTRGNEVMGLLKPIFNVTDAQIDAAWMATVARRG